MSPVREEQHLLERAGALLGDPRLSRLPQAQELLLSRLDGRRHAAKPGMVRWLYACPAIAALAVVTAIAIHRRPAETTNSAAVVQFVVDGEHVPDDRPIDADKPTVVGFSDGSRVTLAPNTRVQVNRRSPTGATVVVERGSIKVDVVHRDATSWHVLAGPYDIRITGTRFDTDWDADSAALRIVMHEGHVVVTGCGAEIAEVDHGQSLDRRCENAAKSPVVPAPALSLPPVAPQVTPSVIVEAARPAGQRAPSTAPAITRRSTESEASRRTALFRAGEVASIYESVAARFERACSETTSATDLWVLAESARRTAHLSDAHHGWSELLRRFPASTEAQSAPFVLGRIAADGGDVKNAHDWFERASRSGSPALRREALGRWMIAATSLGNTEEATAVARQYLRDFPAGPQAERARELAGRQ